MPESLLPAILSEEDAKAIQELSKFGTASVELVHAFGSAVMGTLGTIPRRLVEKVFDSWVTPKQAENLIQIDNKRRAHLAARNVEDPQSISLDIGIPILEAASETSLEEIQDLWARLLASAQEVEKAPQIRLNYVETIRSLCPDDAAVFKALFDATGDELTRKWVASTLHFSHDRVEVSLECLVRLGCATASAAVGRYYPSAFGRELWRILSD